MKIQWSKLHVYSKKNENLNSPWQMALESFDDATHLKIESDGVWSALDSVMPNCGPDGLAGIKLPDGILVLSGCPFGALVGKLGGSSASHKVLEEPNENLAVSEPFAIGAFCILKIPEDMPGPLFIGFNMVSQSVKIEKLSVNIYGGCLTV